MVQPATAVFVMIASPSDVGEARQAVYTALSRWNETNTATRNVVLVPLRWETGAVPMLGGDGQRIINTQLVEKADVVVALFGSRVGAATPDAISGTVAEIEKAEQDGKAVHLYFSTAPHPNDVDLKQLQALKKFQSAASERGLYGTFGSPEELTAHIWQAIDHDLANVLNLSGVPTLSTPSGVQLSVQPGQEQVAETDNKGRLRSRTRRWLEVTNSGDEDALELSIESGEPGMRVLQEGPTVIHAGQTRRIPLVYSLGGSSDPVVKVTWSESAGVRNREFHVG